MDSQCLPLIWGAPTCQSEAVRGFRTRAAMSVRYPNSLVLALLLASACGGEPSDGVNELARRLKDPDSRVRHIAVGELAKLGEGAAPAVPALAVALTDDYVGIRRDAGRALGDMGPVARGAVPALIVGLRDEDWFVRSWCARALGKIGADAAAAVPSLAAALGEGNSDRDTIAVSLGKIGARAEAAVPALIELLKSDRNRYAVQALGMIGPAAKSSVPALIDALENPDRRDDARDVLRGVDWSRDLQAGCEVALGLIGPAAREAIPALERAARLGSENATAALRLIRGPLGKAEGARDGAK